MIDETLNWIVWKLGALTYYYCFYGENLCQEMLPRIMRFVKAKMRSPKKSWNIFFNKDVKSGWDKHIQSVKKSQPQKGDKKNNNIVIIINFWIQQKE